MNTELTNSINATSEEAQYDASAKRLLSQKNILAHILINTVDEFKGMNYKDVVPLIEGTPYISTVPIEPGLTNAKVENDGQRITGFNSEDKELNEGLVWFDIVFYVSRLISSQKERDFKNSDYNNIKKVYSIWVCMNISQNCMNHIHLVNKNILGSYKWKGDIGLLNIVMIGLSEELPEHNKDYELHRLLGTLLSNELTATEKLNIIGNEYDIPIEEKFREEVDIMCNLSQSVKEKGIAIGENIGEKRGIAIGEERGKTIGEASVIRTMYNNGLTPEQISKMTSKSIDDINAILEVE